MSEAHLHNLIKAIKRGDIDSIASLISSGVDVNAYNEQGLTPLHIAAAKDNPQVLKVLIDDGANVNQLSQTGFAPLSFAVLWKQKKAAEFLQGVGAEHEAEHPFAAHMKKIYPEIDFDPYRRS